MEDNIEDNNENLYSDNSLNDINQTNNSSGQENDSISNNKKEENTFDGRIWANILDFNVNLDSQLISKANLIFGASTLILVFILNKLTLIENIIFNISLLPHLILIAGSFLSSLLSVMVILPKLRIFSKKERFKEDIFYYKNIRKYYSRDDYCRFLADLPTDNKRIGEAYANQVYSLATNILPFKFKMLKLSGWSLVISILLSIIFFLLILYF